MANTINKSKKTQPFGVQQPTITSAPQTTQTISRPQSVTSAAPTKDEIAKRAYEIYVQKGCPQGQDEQIWLQAEKELRSKKMATTSSR